MTKLSIQIHNATNVLEFETREELDDFVNYLRNDNSRFSNNLKVIADCVSRERDKTNAVNDYELIPRIIEAINTHVKNVGRLDKFGGQTLTGFVATELTYDKVKDRWETDNGYTFDGTLEYMLMWLTEIAPQYWGNK